MPTKKKTAKPTAPKRSKAEELVAGVHTLHDEALELAESVLFMAGKLKEARENMKSEELVVPYDNGGGQTGLRENPHFSAYEKLMATYTKSLRQLAEFIENGSKTEKGLNVMAELTSIAGRKIG